MSTLPTSAAVRNVIASELLMQDATPPTARILVADDHALLRLGLRAALEAHGADIVVLDAGCLQDAMERYEAEPDIDMVLLDLNMSDCRGLHGVKRFKEAFPEARVVVFSATQDEFVIRQAESLGACGYIAKSQHPADLAKAIRSLASSSRAAFDVHGVSLVSPSRQTSRYDRIAELGSKHLDILDQILFGCSNQEISKATGLSLGTVKNYVSTILLALDVKSRSHLISLFR